MVENIQHKNGIRKTIHEKAETWVGNGLLAELVSSDFKIKRNHKSLYCIDQSLGHIYMM